MSHACDSPQRQQHTGTLQCGRQLSPRPAACGARPAWARPPRGPRRPGRTGRTACAASAAWAASAGAGCTAGPPAAAAAAGGWRTPDAAGRRAAAAGPGGQSALARPRVTPARTCVHGCQQAPLPPGTHGSLSRRAGVEPHHGLSKGCAQPRVSVWLQLEHVPQAMQPSNVHRPMCGCTAAACRPLQAAGRRRRAFLHALQQQGMKARNAPKPGTHRLPRQAMATTHTMPACQLSAQPLQLGAASQAPQERPQHHRWSGLDTRSSRLLAHRPGSPAARRQACAVGGQAACGGCCLMRYCSAALCTTQVQQPASCPGHGSAPGWSEGPLDLHLRRGCL